MWDAWARGQIAESTERSIESLVNRKGRDRLRTEVEDSSIRPGISQPNVMAHTQTSNQSMVGP